MAIRASPDGREGAATVTSTTERQFAEGCYVVSVRALSFRSYLAPALLAVVALTFLIVGGPSKDELVLRQATLALFG
jgi:hypothetical protein